jgi:hypothetical protein
MDKIKRDNLIFGFLFFGTLLIYFVAGMLFYKYVFTPSDNLMGEWRNAGYERFIRVRIDDKAVDFNITRIVKHEIGHELWYRMYESQYPSDDNEAFAEMCEDNFDKCVELYLEYENQKRGEKNE